MLVCWDCGVGLIVLFYWFCFSFFVCLCGLVCFSICLLSFWDLFVAYGVWVGLFGVGGFFCLFCLGLTLGDLMLRYLTRLLWV